MRNKVFALENCHGKLFFVTPALFFQYLEANRFFFALAPFDEFAFEIGFGLDYFFHVHVKFQNAVENKILREEKFFIEIYSSDQRLECIAMHGGMFKSGIRIMRNEFVQSEFYGKLVEMIAAHDLRAHFGKKAF